MPLGASNHHFAFEPSIVWMTETLVWLLQSFEARIIPTLSFDSRSAAAGFCQALEVVVLRRRHRDVALTIPPEELIEQRGVAAISMAEIEILTFLPLLGIHLIDQAVAAVAIVCGERGLLTRPAEERGHDRGAGVVAIHWRNAKEGHDKRH